MKIGIIGCGNMGSALIAGILREKLYEIYVYDIDQSKLKQAMSRWDLKKSSGLRDIAEKCGVMILAVKPLDVETVLKEVKNKFDKTGKILISIAAGIKTDLIRKYLKKALAVRVMPNTPALVGEGVSGIYFDGIFSDNQKNMVLNIFRTIGIAEVVKREDLLDAVTGLSGSGPAYVFAFINALADAGVMEGLPRDVARRLAVYTVGGSAVLAAESLEAGIHLEELKDRVTSSGGTTAEGLLALEEGSFRASVMKAVRAAARRSKELGEK